MVSLKSRENQKQNLRNQLSMYYERSQNKEKCKIMISSEIKRVLDFEATLEEEIRPVSFHFPLQKTHKTDICNLYLFFFPFSRSPDYLCYFWTKKQRNTYFSMPIVMICIFFFPTIYPMTTLTFFSS